MEDFNSISDLNDKIIFAIESLTPNCYLEQRNWSKIKAQLKMRYPENRKLWFYEDVLDKFMDPHMKIQENSIPTHFMPVFFKYFEGEIYVHSWSDHGTENLGLLKKINGIRLRSIEKSLSATSISTDTQLSYFIIRALKRITERCNRVALETLSEDKLQQFNIECLDIDPSILRCISENRSFEGYKYHDYSFASYFCPSNFFAKGCANLYIETLLKCSPQKPLIIDLRYCPGGLINEAAQFLRSFLGTGDEYTYKRIIKKAGEDQFQDILITTTSNKMMQFKRHYILINSRTMSCAEYIIANYFRTKSNNSIIIGEPTMGALTESKLLPLSSDLTLVAVCSVISGIKEVHPDWPCPESSELSEFGTIKDPMLQMIKNKEEYYHEA